MDNDTRNEIISRLATDLVVGATQSGNAWLYDVFRQGFRGLEQRTDQDLFKAYVDAGLDEQFDHDLIIPEEYLK